MKYDEITTETRTKPTPYNAWNKINRGARTFEDNAKIKRNGKKIKLQDFINENNRDCTIYDVLKTYRGDKKLTQQALCTMSHQVADEIAEINNLPDAFKAMKMAENAWRNLPLEIRKEFNNDISEFKMNGAKWAQEKINHFNKLEQQKKQKIEELKQQEMNKQGAQANG